MKILGCYRNRMGKGATGPLTYLAQAKGFKSVKVKYRTVYNTSFFQRPPGVGAKLEKGAPPPFDPPDLVPRFARPNPELASLA